MTFEEFTEKVLGDITEMIPEMEFDLKRIEKLQGQSYTALSAGKPGADRYANISLDMAFRTMQEEHGGDYDRALNDIINMVGFAAEHMPTVDVSELGDYERIREKLTVQLIPTAINEENLHNIPHHEVEDLSMVYRILLGRSDAGEQSILVTNEMLEHYGVNAEQLRSDALEQCAAHHPARIQPMEEILGMPPGIVPPFMYVAQMEDAQNGAAVMGYPGFFEQAAETMDGSFYIIPSSIHEIILLREECGQGAEGMAKMIKEVNRNEVRQDEVLSDQAYHYDAEEKVFETARGYEERRDRKGQVLDVLIVKNGCYPEEAHISARLESLRNIVHGDIEAVYPYEDSVCLIVNEEGKLAGAPMNRALKDSDEHVTDVIMGDFIIAGVGEKGFRSLTCEEKQKYEALFHQPETFVRLGNTVIAVPVTDEMVEKTAAKDKEQSKKLPEKHETR